MTNFFKRLKESFELPIAVSLIGFGILFFIAKLSEGLQLNELVVAITTVCFAAVIGSYSLYVVKYVIKTSKKISGQTRIFLSYSKSIEERAFELRNALQSAGAVVWTDHSDENSPTKLMSITNSIIQNSNSVIIMLSGPASSYINQEIDLAREQNVPVITIIDKGREANALPNQMSSTFEIDSSSMNIKEIASIAMLQSDKSYRGT